MSDFRYQLSPSATTATLTLVGDIDLADAADLIQSGHEAIENPGISKLVIDASGVTFMDSTALGALIQLQNAADEAAKQLVLAEPSRPVQRVLEITGLTEIFAISEARDSRQSEAQCDAYTGSQRCHLRAGHDGPHVCVTAGAYLTWTGNHEPYRWSLSKPPEWIVGLPWMPDAHPTVSQHRPDPRLS